jgi:hypothetical protein
MRAFLPASFMVPFLLIRPTRSGNNGGQTRKHRGALDVS